MQYLVSVTRTQLQTHDFIIETDTITDQTEIEQLAIDEACDADWSEFANGNVYYEVDLVREID